MRLFAIFAIAAMAMLAGASAQAGVLLYGNLGSNGTTFTQGTTTNSIQNATFRSAVRFKTGSTAVTIDQINLLLDTDQSQFPSPATFSMGLGIYGDDTGNPNLSSSFGSGSAIVDENKSLVSFAITGASLSANTDYWVVANNVGAKWYIGDDVASAYNSSGFTPTGAGVSARRATNFASPSGTWGFDSTNYGIALFGDTTPPAAIPEPALTSLLCFGGIALIRRRMKK
jgi:hypothetical protein